jgi:hypothetical protein
MMEYWKVGLLKRERKRESWNRGIWLFRNSIVPFIHYSIVPSFHCFDSKKAGG